jgi:phosphatidylserine/phosphatidylglycerophosphate/cardiolipin synthase-like enzyme
MFAGPLLGLTLIGSALAGCRAHSAAKAPTNQVPAQSRKQRNEHGPSPSPDAEPSIRPACSEAEIHYSPQEDLEQIDSEILSGASSEIEISAYSFTDPRIASVLEERAGNGVAIRIYTDRSSAAEELSRASLAGPVILDLARTPNITVRVKHSSSLAHMKAYEVDGAVMRTGSANFSANAERRQDNDLLIIRDSAVINSYRSKFEEMWNRPDNEAIR